MTSPSALSHQRISSQAAVIQVGKPDELNE
jgi:hypothetical protein